MKPWDNLFEAEVDLDFGSDGKLHLGTLATTGDQTFFEYTSAFLATGINPAPVSLELKAGLQLIATAGGRLQSMFADALPDGWTRYLLDARLLEAGYDPKSLSALDRLSLVGNNAVGALAFRPSAVADEDRVGVPALTLGDLAATVLRSQAAGDAGIRIAQKLAGSLGGARPKASIWMLGDIPSPAALPGADPWIVKFPSPNLDPMDAGPIEYAYSIMARAAGVEMAPTRLLEALDGPGYFATARFDRLGDRRFHFQSLSGLLDLAPIDRSSYAALFGITEGVTDGAADREQMIRRLVFNVLASNRDDHTRNHGFLMNAENRWVASPAYDITYEALRAHELVVGSNSERPNEVDLRKSVEDAGWDSGLVGPIVTEIGAVVAEWPAFARQAHVPTDTIERIANDLRAKNGTDRKAAALAALAAAYGRGR